LSSQLNEQFSNCFVFILVNCLTTTKYCPPEPRLMISLIVSDLNCNYFSITG